MDNKGKFGVFAVIGGVCCIIGLIVYLVVFQGPYKVEQFVEVGPSETVFLIPTMEDNPEIQVQINSAGELADKKVTSKRISIPLRSRSTGRMPGDFVWVPAAVVRKVNRAPATREWTEIPDPATTPTDDALSCDTQDGTKLYCGISLSATIHEGDCAQYFYQFGERPLDKVMDETIRPFVQGELQKIAKRTTFDQLRKDKKQTFKDLFKAVAEHYKPQGITIEYLGNEGGYEYINPDVQKSIDNLIVEQIKTDIAGKRADLQDIKNSIALERTKSETKAALLFSGSKDALEFVTKLKIWEAMRQARIDGANNFKNGGGQLPETILPNGGNPATVMLNLNK